MLFTELQNSVTFKSYHILKFGNLVVFLIKKGWIIWILRYYFAFFNYFCILSPTLLKLGTDHLHIWARNLEYCVFFKNIVNFWCYTNFARQNCIKTPKTVVFHYLSLQIQHKSKSWKFFEKILQNFWLYM